MAGKKKSTGMSSQKVGVQRLEPTTFVRQPRTPALAPSDRSIVNELLNSSARP